MSKIAESKIVASKRIKDVQAVQSLAVEELFREESIQRRFDVRKPRPVELMPMSWRLITLLLVGLAIGVITFLLMGSFPRKENVFGLIRPRTGEVVIDMRRDGRVSSVFVSEAQFVNAGDPLMAIDSDSSLLDGRSLGTAQLELYDAQLVTSKTQSLAKSTDLSAQIAASDLEIGRQKARIRSIFDRQRLTEQRRDVALPYLQKLESLAARGFVTEREVLRQRDSILSLNIEIKKLQEEETDARNAMAAATIGRISNRARADVEIASAKQDEILLRERAVSGASAKGELIRAPTSGQVTNLTVSPGKWLRTGAPALAILPAGAEYVGELHIPSSAIGFVRPGDRVKLMYDSFPFQKFGFSEGIINLVTELPATDAAEPKERLYLARVTLDKQSVFAFGKAQPLKPGMTLRADIVLEKRSLLEWMLEPLLAVTKRQS